MFKGKEATSEQMAAGAQQKLEFLRGQLLIFLRQKRQQAVRAMAQANAPTASGKAAAGDEDMSWLETME